MIHDVSMVPEVVIGSTTSSTNALSAAVDTNAFAFCAGSYIVLARINSRFGLHQRLFCARPDALPVQATPSYYNPATPNRTAGNRGNQPFRDDARLSSAAGDCNTDSPNRIKSTYRFRSLTSVALSPSGRFLAIGETGYRPRVLIFSTESTASTDVPLACLTEHTFGVRALAFSHDSRWLCSLGDLHDGGLFLWSVHPKTGALRLDSSNRCTTAETIAWMGTSVVSVGIRNVKIWRLERPPSPSKARRGVESISGGPMSSPAPRTFAGRNCLLGPLKDATFTCVVGISEDRAVLATQDGAVCILEDTNRSHHLYQVSKKNYRITCISLDRSSGVVWIGGEGVQPEPLPLDVLLTAQDASAALEDFKVPDEKAKPTIENIYNMTAICCIGRQLITIDSNRNMRIYDVAHDSCDTTNLKAIQTLACHDSPILGVINLSKPNDGQSGFLTFSERGQVLHWQWDGTCTCSYSVHMNQPLNSDSGDLNELRVARIFTECEMLLVGDKAGSLHLLSLRGEVCDVVRAHDSEVLDLALYEIDGKIPLAASCGRDRTIQIFLVVDKKCSLQQSKLNEHAGPIRRLEFAESGCLLASMSLDKTVIFHSKVLRTDGSIAFVSTKVINFKATPLDMCLLPDVASILLVSAMDRCIRNISVTQGRVIHTIKASDHLNGESAAISRLSVGNLDEQPTGANVVVGFSTADRSIRLYDLDTGLLLGLDYGQAAISDLAFIKASMPDGQVVNRIVSTGLEGTIVIWKLAQKDTRHSGGSGTADPDTIKLQPSSAQRPLRRILSKTEITEHQRVLGSQSRGESVPSRNLSPSLSRRKISRFAVTAASEGSGSSFPERTRSALLITGNVSQRNQPKDFSFDASSKHRVRHRPRRSSLDDPYKEITVNSTSNIDSAATLVAGVLEDFRQQLITSRRTLGSDAEQALKLELQSTLELLAHTGKRRNASYEGSTTEPFYDYLANMIDERLALRLNSKDQIGPKEDTEPCWAENSGGHLA